MKSLIIILIFILYCGIAIGKEPKGINLHTIEIVVPSSISSNHINNCNPDCAVQSNDGIGFQVGPIFCIWLTNSYGNPGRVCGIEPAKAEVDFKFVKAGIAVWIMEITGYKKTEKKKDSNDKWVYTEKDIVVYPGPWPKFQVGFNPLWRYTNNFYINYNKIYFPAVAIEWWTITIYDRRF